MGASFFLLSNNEYLYSYILYKKSPHVKKNVGLRSKKIKKGLNCYGKGDVGKGDVGANANIY
jgi:hypothetical protein